MNGVDDPAGIVDADALSNAVPTSDPAGIEEPDMGMMLLDFLGEKRGVCVGMERKESFAEA